MITVIAETDQHALSVPTLECVQEACDIADVIGVPVHVLLPGHTISALAQELAAYGADRVTCIEHAALEWFSADAWLAALGPLVAQAEHLILAPDSGHIRAWLPRLALRRAIPLISGCLQISASSSSHLELTRPVHTGARHERYIQPASSPLIATLTPGGRGVTAAHPWRTADVVHVVPELDPGAVRDRVERMIPADPRTVDLTEAERIISGGLGVGGPEGVLLLGQLAERLGAALGGTRVIADRGWIPTERFIGTTGKIVAPELYMAFGVSGAGQHISGIRASETVVVVNTDRTAPLFSIADLGIVGDLHQIVPALIDQLQTRE